MTETGSFFQVKVRPTQAIERAAAAVAHRPTVRRHSGAARGANHPGQAVELTRNKTGATDAERCWPAVDMRQREHRRMSRELRAGAREGPKNLPPSPAGGERQSYNQKPRPPPGT